MKSKRIYFTISAIFLCFTLSFGQTKPSKTNTKKKAAPKSVSVYLCDSETDKLFHKRRTCAGLNKCSGEIKFITSVAVLKKYKRKSCTRCSK